MQPTCRPGCSFRFRQDMVADYVLGVSRSTVVPLATAVAASSAFPPIFSPVVLKTDPASWQDAGAFPDLEKLRARIVLADGGVYDNMGLESLVGNVDVVLVSDAGAPMEIEVRPHEDYGRQLGRVRNILIDQTRALRKRWLITEFEAGRARGAYWGIGTRIADYGDEAAMRTESTVTDALDAVPTRLAKFKPEIQGRLANWGYALCDVALRMRARLLFPAATDFPLPMWPLH
jgi:NTE family protein